MKSDVIILGAELDGLIAAMRLVESGYSVRIFSNGASSLSYTPDGIRVLGHTDLGTTITNPFSHISDLKAAHPYQKIGKNQLKLALDWYCDTHEKLHQKMVANGENQLAISAAGLASNIYAVGEHQATLGKIQEKNVAVIKFVGHRDSPTDLLADGLRKQNIETTIVELKPPGLIFENAALARSFDAMDLNDAYFEDVRNVIPKNTEVVIFPAVLGLHKFQRTMSNAQRVIGLPCLEVPTLPPSIPGLRLENTIRAQLKNSGVTFQTGTYPTNCSIDTNKTVSLLDDSGRCYQASVAIISSGGVLMGGLEVDSHGIVHETAFGLDVFQSQPLVADGVFESLNALHTAGVEIDSLLRPKTKGSYQYHNLFVTGRSLAHWDPGQESSADGVCIATGWAAAENVRTYLEKRNAA